MGIRRGALAVAAVAIVLLLPPAATAGHPLSVGYDSLAKIRWAGMQYRRDIGKRRAAG